jgi:hypothetical protein
MSLRLDMRDSQALDGFGTFELASPIGIVSRSDVFQ